MALLAGVLLLAALAGVGYHQWQEPEWYRFGTVTEGVLYRSGRLDPEALAAAVARHGLRTVVDLTPATGGNARFHEEERRVLAAAGVRYVEMPIRGRDSPAPEQVGAWLALLADAKSHPVLVHCERGVHRTGQMVAVYEMEYRGKSPEQALADAPRHGHRVKPGMSEFILGYRPRLLASRDGSGAAASAAPRGTLLSHPAAGVTAGPR